MGEDELAFSIEGGDTNSSPVGDFSSLNLFGNAVVNPWRKGGAMNPSAKLGMNMGTASMGLQGLATIGGIWNAYQSQKLAKEQFAFTKAMANTNLNNQIKSYNTALSDRSRTRGAMEGQSAAQVQSYIDTNQMTR